MSNKFFHSVYLDASLCKGCINCIKRCPTQAIRVRNGKACITSEFCIDCGECVRTCSAHAKKIQSDSLEEILNKYEYTVALPAPSLYGQYNHLRDINILLTALIYLGFDDVLEVSAGAEIVTKASIDYIYSHPEQHPILSTACPTIIRLIRVRFPNLIDHLLPINPPVEVAATLARKRAMQKTGLPADKIGIVFISPCPSKVTYVHAPLGKEKSQIDAAVAVKDIYPLLLPHMKVAEKAPLNLQLAGTVGLGWGTSGGEALGIGSRNHLAADGIENVIRVLEDLEDEKFSSLKFIELNACPGGCVGGVLNVENPYVAKTKLGRLFRYMPNSRTADELHVLPTDLKWSEEVEYEPVYQIGSNMMESILKMKEINRLAKEFPGLDCGCCGSPTCRALAEDIVKGESEVHDCIHILRDHIHQISSTYTKHAREAILDSDDPNACIALLTHYADQLTEELNLLDSHTPRHRDQDKNRQKEPS